LPVSGTKAVLCDRLCSGELSSDYTYEYAPEKFSRARFEYGAQQGSKRSSGLSNEALKKMCRENGLVVSGKRYDLVLRLLQSKSGKGGAPKRAAGKVDDEGNFQPKKRAKSMKLPDVEKIKQRTFKKFFPPDSVTDRWSNNKYKYHPTDCVEFANNIMEKEIFEKELFERGEEALAWEIIDALLYRFTVGNVERRREHAAKHRGGMYMMIGGTEISFGRCYYELKHDFLPKIVKAMEATEDKSVLEDMRDTLWDFQTRKLDECRQFNEVYVGGETKSFKDILNNFLPQEAKETN